MDDNIKTDQCGFDLLFNKNVPHILEKIFLNLEDYDSFMACQNVCKAWRGLFSSELFKKRAKDLLYEDVWVNEDVRYVIKQLEGWAFYGHK